MDGKNPSTVEEVFAALDGINAVASLTGDRFKTVQNWKYIRSFPPRTYVAMTTELKKRGLRAPASLWRMAEPAEAS